MLIKFTPVRKNVWNILIGGRTMGQVVKTRGGSVKSVLSRFECSRAVANDGAAASSMFRAIEACVAHWAA